MKSVLISIQPRHVENICTVVGEKDGKPIYKKRIEVRKTAPKLEVPFKCYIYCTQDKYHHLYDLRKASNGELSLNVVPHNKTSFVAGGYLNGKVIGEFVCDWVDKFAYKNGGFLALESISYTNSCLKQTCLSDKEFREYAKEKSCYGWHISELKIYDHPKELGEFGVACHKDDCEKCGNCPHLEMWQGSFPCEDGGGERCRVGNIKPITRPPQSWCYVEDL